MLGKHAPQTSLYDVGNVFPLKLPPRSFHGQLANAAERKIFKDADFEKLYCANNGRPSTPPSQLAFLVILQGHAGVSDAEAIERSAYDLRWCAVLRKPGGEQLCAKSTLCIFRAQLLLHDKIRAVFKASLHEAKTAGLLKGEALWVATDTKPIEGRGAVEDTYNLLATGIGMLAGALAGKAGKSKPAWLAEAGLERYSEVSVKGSVDIDWSDKAAKERFLTEIVADARKLLSLANGQGEKIKSAAELLGQLLLQDVEEVSGEDGPRASVKEGTAPGRIPSATDPEMRHGRKSKSKRFNGHKAAIVTDIESGIIVACDVLGGDEADSTGVLALTEQAEANTSLKVEVTIGDCAYGGGAIRKEYEAAGRTLLAKVPQESANGGRFKKSDFTIDLESRSATCPAGHTSNEFREHPDGGLTFYFDDYCAGCPLRAKCTTSEYGRTLSVHPQEALIQAARVLQATPEGRGQLRKRLIVENALARLSHLGISHARYKGRKKTGFQLAIASTVANFRRTWNWTARQTANLVTIVGPIGVSGHNTQLSAG